MGESTPGACALVLMLAACGTGGGDADRGAPADSDPPVDTDAPGGDTDASSTCAPAASFLDLSGAPGAGDGYDAPSVQVGCEGDVLVVESNAMVPYTFVQTTPNALVPGTYRWEIPLDAAVAAAPTDLPLLGYVAVAVNGIPIFGPNEGAVPEAEAFGDPVFNGIMDPCLGHTAFVYHYHALAQRCLTQASTTTATPWTQPEPSADTASPVLAWAADGFPILGRFECADAGCTAVVELTSGWAKTGDPTKDAWDAYTWSASDDPTVLDRCNGHTGPGGDYHYHATSGFPYVLGCYAGTPVGAGGGPGGGGAGGPPGP